MGSGASSSRRGFLLGLAVSALAPRPTWAEAGAPRYLAAARRADGEFVLCGLAEDGRRVFAVPLPARGHAAAAHPTRPEAVAFARRPGNFALVLDCRRNGRMTARLEAPPGRHFFGHGAFSADGSRLYTSENAFEEGQGRIGIWDADNGYVRIGENPSHGIGPHEILRLPGRETLVVANGGIETHPQSGRAKLNLGQMEPNLAYVTPSGALLEKVSLDPDWHYQSIRHLSARSDGTIAAACQWQADVTDAPPLLLLHRSGGAVRLLSAPEPGHRRMKGYAGSVAFSGNGEKVAISSPRGGLVQVFETETGNWHADHALPDACGIATANTGFCITTGTGLIGKVETAGFTELERQDLQWDNHLVALNTTAT